MERFVRGFGRWEAWGKDRHFEDDTLANRQIPVTFFQDRTVPHGQLRVFSCFPNRASVAMLPRFESDRTEHN